MKLLKICVALLTLAVLTNCDDSLNGPSGSSLNYEPQLLSIGKQVDFGKINKDDIMIKLVGMGANCYELEHSASIRENCPLNADNQWLEFMMYGGKYKVSFKYSTTTNKEVWLQLYKYEVL